MPIAKQDEPKIVEAYKRGDTVKKMFADFPTLNSTVLKTILEEHGVPRRGRGHNFKNAWEIHKKNGTSPHSVSKKSPRWLIVQSTAIQ